MLKNQNNIFIIVLVTFIAQELASIRLSHFVGFAIDEKCHTQSEEIRMFESRGEIMC